LFSCVVASLFRGCESKIQKKRGKKKNISATSGKMVPLFLRKKPIDIEQQQTKQTTTTTNRKSAEKTPENVDVGGRGSFYNHRLDTSTMCVCVSSP
jgi:hypothetical protein